MKKALLYLFALAAIVACSTTEKPEVDKPTPEPEKQSIEIVIDQERLTAYQVVYSIYPDDKEAYYYSDVMSKARWESADLDQIKAEYDESLRNFANLTGATYEEVLEQMLFKGDSEELLSNAGYRGDTDFVIFAFYWNGEVSEFSFAEFRTPAHIDSKESVAISFDGVDAYAMSVKLEPSAGVAESSAVLCPQAVSMFHCPAMSSRVVSFCAVHPGSTTALISRIFFTIVFIELFFLFV